VEYRDMHGKWCCTVSSMSTIAARGRMRSVDTATHMHPRALGSTQIRYIHDRKWAMNTKTHIELKTPSIANLGRIYV
jgi:hypothetical protein